MSEEERGTPFAKAIMGVLHNTTRAEGLAKQLVSGAVRETIEVVARAHNLDAVALRDSFEGDIVGRYTSVSGDHRSFEARFCTATTRAKKRCTKPALFGNFCKVHYTSQSEAEEAQARRLVSISAYAERLSQMPPSQMQ